MTRRRRSRRQLIVSDVDNTLLGSDDDLARFASWYEENRADVHLVYASGRFYDSVAESVRGTELPAPTAIAGGVGTDIRLYPSGRPILDWEDRLERWDDGKVRDVLAAHDRLELQPADRQSELKVSYFLRNAPIRELNQIRASLTAASLSAEVTYSSNRDLDVLPAGFSKGAAAEFLAEYFEFRLKDILVFGDSLNDLSMFTRGFRGGVVGNAHPELAALRSPLVYHASAHYAAGVLEGLNYWWDRADRWERMAAGEPLEIGSR